MERLSDGDAFTARELALRGFTPSRIGELLGVDGELVDAELTGKHTAEAEPATHAEPVVVDVPAPPVDAEAWPPPVNARTVWDSVWISEGYGRGHEAQVREVLLWGQRVKINAENLVWCPCCHRFRTTAELSHPWNPHLVGLPHRGGMLPLDPDDASPIRADYGDPRGLGGWAW